MNRNTKSPKYEFITNDTQLSPHIEKMKKSPYIAIDTEFIRYNTYYPKLCTLQLCYEKDYALVIDCLSENINLTSLFNVLYQEKIIKIFHSAKQDLEIFFNLNKKIPPNVFDTQIAALLLNYQSNISYDKLVHNTLNITLDKKEKVSNWAHRPLTNNQIQYAAYDALYLYQSYEVLISLIHKQKKSKYLQSIFNSISEETNYIFNVDRYIEKNYHKLNNPVSYCIVQSLLNWREIYVENKNISRNKLISNENIKIIAYSSHLDDEILLEKISTCINPSIGKNNSNYVLEIFDIIKKCLNLTSEQIENIIPNKQPTLNKEQTSLHGILKTYLEYLSTKYEINSAIIASNDNLSDLITKHNEKNNPLLHDWRYKIFGKNACNFLQGKKGLYIKDFNFIIK